MKQMLYDILIQTITEQQKQLYRLAFSYLNHQEDALDAVQNSVCKALEHYTELKSPLAIKPWLYRIVINESLILLKKRKRESLSLEGSEPEESYCEKQYETTPSLFSELDLLDDDIQAIIRLRFFEELSLKEIAEIMNLNLNTVKSKLYRGLKQLRNILQEEDL